MCETMVTGAGPISSDTLREEDLVTCFLAEVRARVEQMPIIELARRGVALVDVLRECERIDTARHEERGYYESEQCEWDLDWLFVTLEDLAPDGTWFGAHEGDGACFGFWVVEGEDETC